MTTPAHIDAFLPTAFGLAGLLYFWLAARVAMTGPRNAGHAIACILFLIGTLEIGSAFSYGVNEANLYGVGRALTFFAAGFIPVLLYRAYREYTASPPSGLQIVALSIIPAVTTLLVVTNPLHELTWSAAGTDATAHFVTHYDGAWYGRVHLPFTFGLFAYAIVALAGRLPTIARAHRGKIGLLIVCAGLPYAVSAANNVFGVGPIDFPFTASALVAMLPFYWWGSMSMRVYEFSPLAYQTLFDHVRDPIIVIDQARRIISANRPAQAMLNASEAELIGRNFWRQMPHAREALDRPSDGDLTQTVCLRPERYYELSSAPLVGPNGHPHGTVIICRDVTERKETLKRLADSEQLIRTLVEHSSNGILRFARDPEDPNRYRCVFANRAAERCLESASGTLVGMPLDKLEMLKPQQLIERYGIGGGSGGIRSYEAEIEIANGERWLRIVAEPVGEDFSVTLIDVTKRKRHENKMLADALKDPLTGVLNRRGFEQAAMRIDEYGSGAAVYLDLNQFKAINDRFGHHAGDALLKAFGHRLEFCLRPEDILARLGGDEFVILLPGIGHEDAKAVAERLVESASEAYLIQGQEIHCMASVGIAFMPDHATEIWDLVAAADRAMYKVKASHEGEAANDRAAYVEAAIAS